ncbi:hypothetical protein ACA910_018211 [Epithemia clementina (nom. ined.)]
MTQSDDQPSQNIFRSTLIFVLSKRSYTHQVQSLKSLRIRQEDYRRREVYAMSNLQQRLLGALLLYLANRLGHVEAFASTQQVVFPTSERQALLEKSKDLNPSPPCLPVTWSNRVGNVLTPISLEGVYSADRPFIWNKIDVGGRMAVIEMPTTTTNGKRDLWVHSPVNLDEPLRKALSNLGTVKYVVSPNYEHLKYASQWHQAFPEAEMWACPGLPERMPEIAWKGEFPHQLRPVSWKNNMDPSDAGSKLPWDAEFLQALHIDMEKNPFTGKPFFNEVIFYHKPSKSLIVTDCFWNYPSRDTPNSDFQEDDTWEMAPRVDVPFGTSLWKFGMDKIYTPFYNNFMVTDPSAYRDVCHHIMNGWDIETIIPCHGDILRGRDLTQKALANFFLGL